MSVATIGADAMARAASPAPTAPAAGPGAMALRGLQKRYGSTVALAGIDLDLKPGEVLGIAGPNGAGKSTLVRVLAGEERADSGEIAIDGAAWSPLTSWTEVAVVHQEPQLFPNLTVAENILAGREGTSIARPKLGDADRALMEALGIGALADVPLERCTLATQQRTEIVRAVARRARLFLFDEPNSALTDQESDQLFREMRAIAAEGRMVVLITHRLTDLVAHTDRVAVIRDGRVRTILSGEALTTEAIAEELVVGSDRDAEGSGERTARSTAGPAGAQPLVEVRDWRHRAGEFENVAFAAAPGEVVALMGVEGSGARELLRSFAGLERCTGTLTVAGETGDAAIRTRTAYVPATRRDSLYSNFSVGENLLVRLGRPDIAGPTLALRRRRMRELAARFVQRFLVKTRTTVQMIRSLSGGNQQKVAIAQALAAGPRLVLLEEPTRGVDIRSKQEIYRLLREFAAEGNAVVIFCTEVLEVFEAADRVIVVSDGRLSAPLRVADYPAVEKLATAITRLERHSRQAAA